MSAHNCVLKQRQFTSTKKLPPEHPSTLTSTQSQHSCSVPDLQDAAQQSARQGAALHHQHCTKRNLNSKCACTHLHEGSSSALLHEGSSACLTSRAPPIFNLNTLIVQCRSAAVVHVQHAAQCKQQHPAMDSLCCLYEPTCVVGCLTVDCPDNLPTA